MGNLCSSGTERSEKKEDNRVPDKPRDGEDEALLPTAVVGLGVGPEGVQVSLEAEGGAGGCGDGFEGNLGKAVESSETALTGAATTGGEQGQFVAKSWEGKTHFVDVVKASTAGIVAENAENVKAATNEAVSQGIQGVENKITDTYQSAAGRLEESAGEVRDKVAADVASGITDVKNFVKSEAVAVESEAQSWKDNSSAWVAEKASFTESATDGVKRLSNSYAETFHAETKSGSAEVSSSAEDKPQCGIFENVKEEFGKKVNDVKSIAESVADDTKQTAEKKVKETIESVRLSASETLTAWTETANQKVGEVTGKVSQETEENADSLGQTRSTQDTSDEKQQHSSFGQSDLDSVGFGSSQTHHQQAVLQQVQNIRQSGLSHNADDVDNVSPGAFFEEYAENVRDHLQDFTSSADEKCQELCSEEPRLFTPVQETCAAGAGETWSEVRNAPYNFSDDVQEAYEKSRTEEVTDTSARFALNQSFSQEKREEGSDLFAGVQATSDDALQFAGDYVKSEVLKKVGFNEGVRTEESQEASTNEGNNEFDKGPKSDDDFIEKAKSLLEAHRHSLDGGRNSVSSVTVTDNDVPGSQQTPEQIAGSEQSSHEATAREFVESIIEKATSLVSESLGQNEPASDSSSPSDPVVERGEETLAPKKRGVMFVSPQISDRSSSSLSSASPPPPPQESDQSPLADSSSSSISQCELVEKEELLVASALPAEYSVSENNNNNNIANNNAEDDDESIQRIAMEVTAKAVQDAIKIVAENGTGIVLNSSDLLNNDIGMGSLSSPDNEDEEATTTDSSQVERGSPVSDLTDTSAHGSVSESLSSYDPGAVFRQDVTSISDFTSAPSGSSTAPHPDNKWALEESSSKPNDKMADLINFDDGSTSHAETPTPTNATSFDTYPHQPPRVSNDDPTLSSDVPSSLSPVDELPSSPNKPMIVINSPDSAHHTNGSCEDVASPQTEALI